MTPKRRERDHAQPGRLFDDEREWPDGITRRLTTSHRGQRDQRGFYPYIARIGSSENEVLVLDESR